MAFVEDLSDPESPVLLPDGSWLVAEMGLERGWITWISPDGTDRRTVVKTGRPNGIAVDDGGTIWIAESLTPALVRATLDGESEVVLTRSREGDFIWPNDIVIGPDGALYMTDSGIPFQEFVEALPSQPMLEDCEVVGSVYRIDVEKGEAETFDTGLQFANGITFGPDGDLYVSDLLTGMVYRYRSVDGTVAGGREDFANVVDPDGPTGFRGPDGMAFGTDGRLYVTVHAQGNVAVLRPDGTLDRRIATLGPDPTNVAFGPEGQRRLYVTEQGSGTFDAIEVETDGQQLFGRVGGGR